MSRTLHIRTARPSCRSSPETKPSVSLGPAVNIRKAALPRLSRSAAVKVFRFDVWRLIENGQKLFAATRDALCCRRSHSAICSAKGEAKTSSTDKGCYSAISTAFWYSSSGTLTVMLIALLLGPS